MLFRVVLGNIEWKMFFPDYNTHTAQYPIKKMQPDIETGHVIECNKGNIFL